MLNWQACKYDPRKFLVKGTELNRTFCGPNHRYMIYEVCALDADRMSTTTYYVRDAETISDEALRAGKRPAIVFRSQDLEQCVAFCNKIS